MSCNIPYWTQPDYSGAREGRSFVLDGTSSSYVGKQPTSELDITYDGEQTVVRVPREPDAEQDPDTVEPPVEDPVVERELIAAEFCLNEEQFRIPRTYQMLEEEGFAAMEQINLFRAQQTPTALPLVWNNNLAHAALMHATDHLVRGYNLKHAVQNHPWGYNWVNRARASGFDQNQVVENIGTGKPVHEFRNEIQGLIDPPLIQTTYSYLRSQSLLDQVFRWDIMNTKIISEGDPAGEGHHQQNISDVWTHFGCASVELPFCMNVGPGYLGWDTSPAAQEAYLLNPYHPDKAMDLFDGSQLDLWIYGWSIVVYLLGNEKQDGSSVHLTPPELFDTTDLPSYVEPIPDYRFDTVIVEGEPAVPAGTPPAGAYDPTPKFP